MAQSPNQDENRKSGFAYAAALTLFASVVSGCGLGYLLDRWLETQPWLLVGGIVLGSAVGLYEFVRLSSKTY
ncbi:MAG TPA: AtpZ/AtpI family protein [Pyrinomonadaceae bacterium]|jgi:F0F1-type ATP synthase assembly protein I|nr:AtpZ/AtpI family protein [Pyrinomonadaceae bacterium]